MGQSALVPVCCLAVALGWAQPAQAAKAEDGVYVYNLFREASNCQELFGRLRRLTLRPTVILSIEEGPEFILDRPDGEQQLACVLGFLRGSERRVKAMFLQDPVFLDRGQEAVRRAERLGEFIAEHPEDLAGVQINVEPHSDQRWPEADATGRSRLLQGLLELLGQVRPHLEGFPLSVVVPWWYSHIAPDVREASPKSLFEAADEVYMMAYGDEDPRTDENFAGSLRARLGSAFAFSEFGPTHVILSKHEFLSRRRLEDELKRLRRALASSPGFAGTAVFHATSDFQAATAQPPPGRVRNR